ncbi:GNAT family N-acetyltransferase [Balneatrix alpica]|uniref:GNAT family N-acetyltransferase n=1 Tax=Balneatrix alpica TaxID=75684 RepID=A0ABV5ZD20_9GAMM|nr:GNAT family N-acetyltransferase [Balneatrix alpica]
MPYQIKTLTPEHAQAYSRLMLEALALEPLAFTSSVQERASLPPAWWRQRLAGFAQAGEQILGLYCDEELVGCVGLVLQARQRIRHKALVSGLYVAPGHRGQGGARQLMQALLQLASTRPELRLLQLTVTAGNHGAERLYQQLGFQCYGEEPEAVRLGEGFVSKKLMWRRLSTPKESGHAGT